MRTRSGADHKLPSDVEDPTSSFPPSMREEKEMADDANDGGKNEMESFENEDEPNDSLSEHESSVGGQEQIDDYDYSGSITDLEKYGLDLQKFNGVKTKTKRHTGEIQINFDKAGNLWLSYVDGESGHIASKYTAYATANK